MELSRRKILAGMGAVGAAGAAAGLGTSALFSDAEEFANNQITAGQLDLVMDWEEHYSFPQIYSDFDDPTVEDGNDLDVIRSDPADDPSLNEDNYTGLPIPETDADGRDPVVWARNNDDPAGTGESSLELYFANTVIEAFPDDGNTDPEGTFTFLDSGDDGEKLPNTSTPCNLLADVPEPGLQLYNESSPDGPPGGDYQQPGRTLNEDTYDSADDEYEPLLNLLDVKPGDFGEFTFSTHICDNPGYLWLQMPGGLTENENGLTEPEETIANDSAGDGGELAENVETTLWYDDNCNNRIDGDVKPLVLLVVVDSSQSQEDVLGDIAAAGDRLADRLTNDAETDVYGGVITLEATGDERDALLQSLSGEDPIAEVSKYQGEFAPGGDILPGPGEVGGNSPLPHAIDVAREYLNDVVANDPFGQGIPQNAQKEILFLSDGAPGYGVGDGGSDAGPGRGALIDNDSGNIVTDSSGSDIVSDYFDTLPNNEIVRYPDPNTTDGGTSRAETVLTARDIDGNEFIAGSGNTDQGPGPKVDNLDDQGAPSDPYGTDPADISGDNDITIRGVVSYDPSNLTSSQQQTAEDTLLAIATGSAWYNLGQNSSTSVADAVFSDQNVTGSSEEVIFRGTLDELATFLDPSQNGPEMLDADRTTSDNDCFAAGAIHCFGLSWWVPEDVGNEIQSDSVSFDLGFYTEQCRNNDNPTGP
jgi:predicted ribosomally synthesized peptide with SipW-like signal peptide